MNKFMCIGNLGKDPERIQTSTGKAMAKFSVAVNESYTDKNTGDLMERTEWVNLTAFGPRAENILKYLHKGSKVFVEASLRNGSYPDKNFPEVTHYTVEFIVQNIEFLTPKSQSSDARSSVKVKKKAEQPAAAAKKVVGSDVDLDDDKIPF